MHNTGCIRAMQSLHAIMPSKACMHGTIGLCSHVSQGIMLAAMTGQARQGQAVSLNFQAVCLTDVPLA